MSTLRLEPITDLDAARDEWRAVADHAGNPFATWEWVSAWWRHFGAGRTLRAVACRRPDGALAAILPLCLQRVGPVRLLRFIGHGPADELGPVCAREDREVAAAALRAVLARGGFDVFLAERLPADAPPLPRGVALRHEHSPVLRIGGKTWQEFLAQRSANFRHQVGGRERSLARAHGVGWRVTSSADELDADMATFLALHAARWDGTSRAFTPPRTAFHRDFAALALERGWLRLVILELDGRPAAAWYGLRFADADWCYQCGRDPAFERARVGFVMFTWTIRAAFEDGMHEYRFLRGGEAYKSRFADSDCPVETFALARGPVGRAVLRAGSQKAVASAAARFVATV
ncbi:MAG TPA: GNAT family N-acetyltransferase [Solirubrobacteraceae bacterium]